MSVETHSPAPPDAEAPILAAQIAAHFDLLPMPLLINAVVPAIFLGFTRASHDTRSAAWWLIGMAALIAARLVLRRRYLANPARLSPARWGLWCTLGSLGTGLMWGLMSVALWPESVESELLLGTILAGMTAGAVASLTPYFPSFLAFVSCALPPYVAIATFDDTAATRAAGWLVLAFMVAMVTMARILNLNFVRSLRLRFENEALLERVEQQRQLAEAADRDKSDFVAAVSHDLRQPVHALGLFAAALRERTVDPQVAGIVRSIERSVDALEQQFTALLDISRLDAGVVRPRPEHFLIQTLFDRIQLSVQMEAGEKGLRLRFRPSDAVVHGDPELLEVVLRNLVANAVTYTHRGGVLIACRRASTGLRLEVWDQGIGIPGERQQDIFTDYFQMAPVGRKPQRRANVGLGLAIVMRLSRIMGLGIDLRSIVGRGSRFAVSVEQGDPQRVRTARGESAHPAPAHGALVVVIDDEPEICRGMERLLGDWGYHVVSAFSCRQAIEALAETAHPPNLIVTDENLGGGELGSVAVQTILDEFNAEIPVVVLTGESDPESLRAIRTRGYNVLQKPVAVDRLRATMSRLIGKAVLPSAPAAGAMSDAETSPAPPAA
jgi:signal transduction histidine kinase/ActR/RegA family two-component response regulator